MKPAKGFLTQDGEFFTTEIEAEYHEAVIALEEIVEASPGIMFISLINANSEAVKRYVNAYQAWAATEAPHSQDRVNHEDNRSTEEKLNSLLEQPSGRSEPVSDVGSGEQSEALRQQRQGDGSGSGRVDASSIRSGEDMAARTHSRPSRARGRDRNKNLR